MKPHKDKYIQFSRNKDQYYTLNSSILQSKASKEVCAKQLLAKYDNVFQQKFGTGLHDIIFEETRKEIKQTEINEALSAVGDQLTEKTNDAVLAHNVSYTTMSNIRKDLALESSTANTANKYVIKHENFNFDREGVIKYFKENSSTTVIWTNLSKQFQVFQSNGRIALNGPQILKEYAISERLYKIDEKEKRNRRKVRNINIEGLHYKVNKLLPTDAKLKETTRQDILSGKLDIGRPIVPINITQRYIDDAGTLETKVTTIYGRAFTLQKIMDASLFEQESKKLLRPQYPADYSITSAQQELEKKGE